MCCTTTAINAREACCDGCWQSRWSWRSDSTTTSRGSCAVRSVLSANDGDQGVLQCDGGLANGDEATGAGGFCESPSAAKYCDSREPAECTPAEDEYDETSRRGPVSNAWIGPMILSTPSRWVAKTCQLMAAKPARRGPVVPPPGLAVACD